MKKLFLPVLIMLLSTVVFAQIRTDDYNARENSDNTLTLTKYSAKATEVVVPRSINGQTVTAIGRIEQNFFYGEYVYNNKRLTRAIIPDTIKVIGNSAFANNRLTEITLPADLKGIGYYAFRGNRITSVTIPESVILIELFAFQDNPISTLTIYSSFATSGAGFSGPFSGCPITRLTIPANMESVTMERNFETALVTFWKLQGQAGGTYVKRGSEWTLEQRSDRMGTPLAQITKVEIEQIAGTSLLGFTNTDSTRMADISMENEDYSARGNPDFTITITQYSGKDREIVIPETINGYTVTAIGRVESNLLRGEFVFNNKRLISAEIPDNVRSIGNSTFSNNRLSEVTLPAALEEIGYYAFRGNRIRSLIIPEGVTTIELFAFQNNPISTLTILAPFTTSAPGNTGPFSGCPITRLTIPSDMSDEIMERNFEASLVTFWKNQRRAGGTYVKTRNTWSLE